MFNLQGSEIVIILLLALVVLGPEKLPDAMRRMGQFYAELRKMSSGFQEEFRAAVDEPMREMRDTANTLRDSADFTKLQAGERDEKPRSAEMADVGDPVTEPTGDVPSFEPTDEPPEVAAPGLAADSRPAPFDEPAEPDAAADDRADDREPVPAESADDLDETSPDTP